MIADTTTEIIPIIATAPTLTAGNQRRFLEALALIELGKLIEGVSILRELYEVSPTPRLRLELARALMISGHPEEAKRLFILALKDNPPPVVKANIKSFIDKIDSQAGKLKLSLSISHYGNPLQQPSSTTFNFAGIDLTYEPDQTYRNLWGATLSGQYRKELRSGLMISSGLSYRSLPHKAADRLTAEFSMGKRLGNSPVEMQVGAVHLGQINQTFTLPYIQTAYTGQLSSRSVVQPIARIGYYRAKAGAALTGWQGDIFLPVIYTPTPAKSFSIGPTLLRHDVGFVEQSYYSFGVRFAANMQANKFNIEASIQARYSRFDASDPFWGRRRKDRNAFASLMVSSDLIRVGPFLPAAGVSCDITGSTISYYNQRNCDALVEIRKLF